MPTNSAFSVYQYTATRDPTSSKLPFRSRKNATFGARFGIARRLRGRFPPVTGGVTLVSRAVAAHSSRSLAVSWSQRSIISAGTPVTAGAWAASSAILASATISATCWAAPSSGDCGATVAVGGDGNDVTLLPSLSMVKPHGGGRVDQTTESVRYFVPSLSNTSYWLPRIVKNKQISPLSPKCLLRRRRRAIVGGRCTTPRCPKEGPSMRLTCAWLSLTPRVASFLISTRARCLCAADCPHSGQK